MFIQLVFFSFKVFPWDKFPGWMGLYGHFHTSEFEPLAPTFISNINVFRVCRKKFLIFVPWLCLYSFFSLLHQVQVTFLLRKVILILKHCLWAPSSFQFFDFAFQFQVIETFFCKWQAFHNFCNMAISPQWILLKSWAGMSGRLGLLASRCSKL